LTNWESSGYLCLRPEKLKWTPFVLSRTKTGAELLQTEAGPDFTPIAWTGTSRSPVDGETPVLDIGDRAKSPCSGGQNSSNEQSGQRGIVRDGAEVTAAQLFDDLLMAAPATLKKHLRVRNASADSIVTTTRSASAWAMLDGDCRAHEEKGDGVVGSAYCASQASPWPPSHV
jgi:hypothetical protein